MHIHLYIQSGYAETSHLWCASNHEAWHEGSETRIVLIVDIWHPDLSDAEAMADNLSQSAIPKLFVMI